MTREERNLGGETAVVLPRRRRPHLRNLRVQLRMLLDVYQSLARCSPAVARRRFDGAEVKVLAVHEQQDLAGRKKGQKVSTTDGTEGTDGLCGSAALRDGSKLPEVGK